MELTDWMPCATSPIRSGWYEVKRGGQAWPGTERIWFDLSHGWDRDSCSSRIEIWTSIDYWRGVLGEVK